MLHTHVYVQQIKRFFLLNFKLFEGASLCVTHSCLPRLDSDLFVCFLYVFMYVEHGLKCQPRKNQHANHGDAATVDRALNQFMIYLNFLSVGVERLHGDSGSRLSQVTLTHEFLLSLQSMAKGKVSMNILKLHVQHYPDHKPSRQKRGKILLSTRRAGSVGSNQGGNQENCLLAFTEI